MNTSLVKIDGFGRDFWQCHFMELEESGERQNGLVWVEQSGTMGVNKSLKITQKIHDDFFIELEFTPRLSVSEAELSVRCQKIFDDFIGELLYYIDHAALPYPYFLGHLFPFVEHDSSLGELLKKDSFMIFLNGRHGTGKKTFILNFLATRFGGFYGANMFAALPALYEDTLHSVVIVPELAYLDPSQQVHLAELLQKQTYSFVFVVSTYSVDSLLEEDLLLPALGTLCRKSLLPFVAKDVDHVALRHWFNLWRAFAPSRISADLGLMFDDEILLNFVQSSPLTIGALYDAILEISQSLILLRKYAQQNDIRQGVEFFEVIAIVLAMKLVGRSQNKIAAYLGISRGSLQHKLRKYNIRYSK